MIKVKLGQYSHSSPELAYNKQILPTNRKQMLVADNISQTLLTN